MASNVEFGRLKHSTLKSIFDTEDPLTSRRRFKFRQPLNFICSVAILIPLVLMLMQFMIAGIADIVAIGIVAFFYFTFLINRAIKIRCPHCRKIILCNTLWICGDCKQRNVRTEDYPFVNKCEHADCGAEPKTYKCHHEQCQQLIFLTSDEDIISYAHRANSPAEIKPKTTQENKENKRDEVAMAELDLKLKGIKDRIQGLKIKTELEQNIEKAERYYEASM